LQHISIISYKTPTHSFFLGEGFLFSKGLAEAPLPSMVSALAEWAGRAESRFSLEKSMMGISKREIPSVLLTYIAHLGSILLKVFQIVLLYAVGGSGALQFSIRKIVNL
jgi:hypothetical protein